MSYCRTYLIPTSEDWNDLYNDNDYDLAVIDEFKAQKTISWLNEWCQGSVMYLKRRAISGYMKAKHIPTIIFSNYSLTECYKKAVEEHPNCLEPLERRLEIIEVKETIDLFK